MPNLPTPADEALAEKILNRFMAEQPTYDQMIDAAQLIAAHVAAQNYMPQDICMEIRAMLQPWDIVGEPNTTWALVKKVTTRLKELEAVAAQAPSGLVEALVEARNWLLCETPGADVLSALETINEALASHKAQPVADVRKFTLGQRVTKVKGSNWTGKVVGFYSTELTPVGYAVESETEVGSVQIYPEAALTEASQPTPVADVRGMVEALDELFNVGLYLGARGLVEGWTGDGKYQPHPDDLPCTLLTNCGTVYRLDEALIKAAKALTSARHAMGGEVKA